jgi:phosphoglycerate dehydrogenase-like enzyme
VILKYLPSNPLSSVSKVIIGSMKIVYLGPADALSAASDVLNSYGVLCAPELCPKKVACHLPDTIAILDASMKIRFDRAMLNQAKELRVISTATTGADHIDAKALSERHIPLFTLQGEEVLRSLTPAAELSWTLLMACARRFRGAVQHVLAGNWTREEFPGIMLKGKTLGLIGCGRIGTWMSRYARAFDMDVIGYDPFANPWPEQICQVGLDALLSTADFVSIHVPLTDSTRGMLGAREFALMKLGAVFINTSRGGLTDEKALLESLLEGRIGAAGVDVLEGEPAIDEHPLVGYARTHDNLIITPHIGGFSPDAVKTVVAYAARRIADVLGQNRECR